MKKPTETKEAEQFCIRGQNGDMLHSCLIHLKKIRMIFHLLLASFYMG